MNGVESQTKIKNKIPYLIIGGTSRVNKKINLLTSPCPTIMAQGLGGAQLTKSSTQFWIEYLDE